MMQDTAFASLKMPRVFFEQVRRLVRIALFRYTKDVSLAFLDALMEEHKSGSCKDCFLSLSVDAGWQRPHSAAL